MFGIVLVSPSLVISMQNETEYPLSESAFAQIVNGFKVLKTISGGAALEQSADFILMSSRYVQAFGSKVGRMDVIPFRISIYEF